MLLLGSCIFTKIPALLDCGYIPTYDYDYEGGAAVFFSFGFLWFSYSFLIVIL